MAKKIKPVEVEANTVVETAEPKVEAPNRPIKESGKKYANKLVVTLADGTQRTYTPFTHGKVWEALANNFHKANEGSTID